MYMHIYIIDMSFHVSNYDSTCQVYSNLTVRMMTMATMVRWNTTTPASKSSLSHKSSSSTSSSSSSSFSSASLISVDIHAMTNQINSNTTAAAGAADYGRDHHQYDHEYPGDDQYNYAGLTGDDTSTDRRDAAAPPPARVPAAPADTCPDSQLQGDGDDDHWRIRALDLLKDSHYGVANDGDYDDNYQLKPPVSADQHRADGQPALTFLMGSPCFKPICPGKQAKVNSYYNRQSEILKEMHGVDELLEINTDALMSQENHSNEESTNKGKVFAIRISNISNMILFVIKVFISVKTISLAIIASTLDSLLDLLSGFILWYTSHNMSKPNPYLYPIGKNRMQPVGILVFASVMATLGMQILIESTRQLASKDSQLALGGTSKYWVIGVMIFVTLVKFFLMILCRSFDDEIVQAYAKDHLFDVVTNSIGLVAAMLASKFFWWIDPAGAILLALYTIWNWSYTVLENVASLVGETAPPEFLQKITYLCCNHHKSIKHIDTIKAYKFGGFYFAEVDIVLPADMPLQDAHDIGESLQNKLESLPEIERAFVHVDYEFSHRPEHGQKITYQNAR